MVPRAFVRQYAVSQQIDEPVADQEIVLHYTLALLNEVGLVGPGRDGDSAGPLRVPTLYGLDPYEMIGEKIMACSRRIGGSSKDVYDLFLWAQRPFDDRLVRRLAVLKAWTDQRRKPRYDPKELLPRVVPASFRWTDISPLVPRKQEADHQAICRRVRERFAFLADCSDDELALLADQTAHRERRLFEALRGEARDWAGAVPR